VPAADRLPQLPRARVVAVGLGQRLAEDVFEVPGLVLAAGFAVCGREGEA
jgi:hypothetical protein